jgi:hypothetical protein
MKKIYFSDDGAVLQHNRNNFTTLVNHKNDGGIAAEWHFFVTSHGSGLCDVGGTSKWQVAKTSLKCPYDKKIIALKYSYEFAQDNIYGITCFYVSGGHHRNSDRAKRMFQ